MTERDNWQEFQQRLHTYVARRVDPAVVDDIVSDILLRLVEHRDRFDQATSSLAWLYRVASNAITDHYRRRSVEQKALQEISSTHTQLKTEDNTPNSAELANCLAPLIKQLPEKYQEALIKTEINGLKQTDAAKQLGLSVSGMKSRVQRGREQLKQVVLRCCEVEINKLGSIVDYTPRNRSPSCNGKC